MSAKLDADMLHEKIAQPTRELDELTLSSKAEEENSNGGSGNGPRNHLSTPREKQSHFRSLDSGFNSKNSSSKKKKSSRKKGYSEKKVSLLEGQHKVSTSTCSDIGCADTKCSFSYHKHHLKDSHSLVQLNSPLNAARLKPKRHMPKNLDTVLHISADEQVIVEVLKTKKGKVYVSEVFIISTNGMEIKIYKPPRNTLLDDNRPPPFPDDSNYIKYFDYQTLPRVYHWEYLVAKKFVDILRAKEPKLIKYGLNTEFYVMENSPDPDMKLVFYDGGSVIKKDKVIHINYMPARNCVAGTRNLYIESMLDKFLNEQQDCEIILKFHESLESCDFPIKIGMQRRCMAKKIHGKEDR